MKVSDFAFRSDGRDVNLTEALDLAWGNAAEEGWEPERLLVHPDVLELACEELGERWREERGVPVYSHVLREIRLECRGGAVILRHTRVSNG